MAGVFDLELNETNAKDDYSDEDSIDVDDQEVTLIFTLFLFIRFN